MNVWKGIEEGQIVYLAGNYQDLGGTLYTPYTYTNGAWVKGVGSRSQTEPTGGTVIKGAKDKEDFLSLVNPQQEQGATEGGGTEWGAQNITKDMFVDEQGNPKTVQEIYTTLDPILTGITEKHLVDYINDILPKYTGVPAEEKGFLEKEKEFTERGLGLKKEADIYGLQPKTGGAITPTTGGGMRGSIDTKAGIKEGFGAAYGTYGLGMEKAAFTEEKGLYELGKGVAGAYETDILGAIGQIETPFAKPGAEAKTTPWASFMAREGGRVSSKSETFLDFLTQLPDAGGM